MTAQVHILMMSALMLVCLGTAQSLSAAEFGSPDRDALKLRIRSTAKAKYSPGSDCNSIRPKVEAIVGKRKSACYMKLFLIESTCDFTKPQAQGNTGNAYAAYGLCSIERSPEIRKKQNRGPDCDRIVTIEDQVRCCQAMVKKTSRAGSYFGPIRRGEVPKCD